MRRKALLILFAIIALAAIAVVVVLPMIDGEMMKVPLVNGITALRNGDANALRACFTPDAVIIVDKEALPAAKALEEVKSLHEMHLFDGEMRFAGYSNVQQRSKTEISAKAIIRTYIEGTDDVPYHRVPIDKTGTVVLKKTGFFTWKIKLVNLDESETGFMK